MADRYSPTVRRRVLGIRLRRAREAAELAQEDAAQQIGMVRTVLSAIENGHRVIRKGDLIALLGIYGTPEVERMRLLEMHPYLRQPAWWRGQGVPEGSFVDLEAEATEIREWDLGLIPGLLQTEQYADAAITSLVPDLAHEERAQRVSVRRQRAELLDGGLKLWAIMHESTLRSQFGGRKIMGEQLLYLADRAEMTNVTIQVLLFDAGGHGGAEGSFVVLDFEEHPPLGYTEKFGKGSWEEREPEVMALRSRWERLLSTAEEPRRSIALVREIAQEMEDSE